MVLKVMWIRDGYGLKDKYLQELPNNDVYCDFRKGWNIRLCVYSTSMNDWKSNGKVVTEQMTTNSFIQYLIQISMYNNWPIIDV